jgi:hypothetical protein
MLGLLIIIHHGHVSVTASGHPVHLLRYAFCLAYISAYAFYLIEYPLNQWSKYILARAFDVMLLPLKYLSKYLWALEQKNKPIRIHPYLTTPQRASHLFEILRI